MELDESIDAFRQLDLEKVKKLFIKNQDIFDIKLEDGGYVEHHIFDLDNSDKKTKEFIEATCRHIKIHKDKNNLTILHIASIKNFYDTIFFIINNMHKAPNIRTCDGFLPIHYAFYHKSYEVARFLLDFIPTESNYLDLCVCESIVNSKDPNNKEILKEIQDRIKKCSITLQRKNSKKIPEIFPEILEDQLDIFLENYMHENTLASSENTAQNLTNEISLSSKRSSKVKHIKDYNYIGKDSIITEETYRNDEVSVNFKPAAATAKHKENVHIPEDIVVTDNQLYKELVYEIKTNRQNFPSYIRKNKKRAIHKTVELWQAAFTVLDNVDELSDLISNFDTTDRNAADYLSRGIFTQAVLLCKPQFIKYLASEGFPINRADKNGDTALHYAARLGREEAIERLIEQNADPKIANSKGNTPEAEALSAQLVNIDRVVELLRAAEPLEQLKAAMKKGNTDKEVLAAIVGKLGDKLPDAFQVAVEYSSAELLMVAIRHGLRLTEEHFLAGKKSPNLEYVLMRTVAESVGDEERFPELFGYYINAQSNINDPVDENGNTLLHAAVEADSEKAVELIVGRCANPNAQNLLQQSPLHIACKKTRGPLKIVSLLLWAGAIEEQDFDGRYPRDYLDQKLQKSFLECVGSYFSIENELVNTTDDPNLERLAKFIRETDVSEKYLEHENRDSLVVSLDNIINKAEREEALRNCATLVFADGETLMSLSMKHDSGLVEYAILKSYEIKEFAQALRIRDKDGNSLLHTAVTLKRVEVIKGLLRTAPDLIYETNNDNKSAYDTARTDFPKIAHQLGKFFVNTIRIENDKRRVIAFLDKQTDLIREFNNYFVDIAAKCLDSSLWRAVVPKLSDPNVKNNGSSLLHLAVSYDRSDLVEIALKNKSININEYDDFKNTPLDIAYKKHANDISILLKKFGGKLHILKAIDSKDSITKKSNSNYSKGSTICAYQTTRGNKNGTTSYCTCDPKAAEHSLEQLKDQILKNTFTFLKNTEMTKKYFPDLLAYALENNNDNAVKKLIQSSKLSINQQNARGQTVLHLIALFNSSDGVKSAVKKISEALQGITDSRPRVPSLRFDAKHKSPIDLASEESKQFFSGFFFNVEEYTPFEKYADEIKSNSLQFIKSALRAGESIVKFKPMKLFSPKFGFDNSDTGYEELLDFCIEQNLAFGLDVLVNTQDFPMDKFASAAQTAYDSEKYSSCEVLVANGFAVKLRDRQTEAEKEFRAGYLLLQEVEEKFDAEKLKRLPERYVPRVVIGLLDGKKYNEILKINGKFGKYNFYRKHTVAVEASHSRITKVINKIKNLGFNFNIEDSYGETPYK